jgi:hypothetical protein
VALAEPASRYSTNSDRTSLMADPTISLNARWSRLHRPLQESNWRLCLDLASIWRFSILNIRGYAFCAICALTALYSLIKPSLGSADQPALRGSQVLHYHNFCVPNSGTDADGPLSGQVPGTIVGMFPLPTTCDFAQVTTAGTRSTLGVAFIVIYK